MFRDACFLNMVMDPTGVVVDDFHFSQHIKRADNVTKPIRYKARREIAKVNYFLIDAGISIMFPPDRHDRNLSGLWGAEKNIPEHQAHLQCIDPFRTDVCQMGMVLKRFVKVNSEPIIITSYINSFYSSRALKVCQRSARLPTS